MKRLVLAALCSLSLSACAQQAAPAGAATPEPAPAATPAAKGPAPAAGTPEARVTEVLRELNPRIAVDSIAKAPIPGFREVVAGGQVVYVSDDGKYLFQGELMDVAARRNLSDDALTKVRGEVLKTLPLADRIVFSPTGTPKHKVVVLTDIECGYCRKFHEDIAKVNAQGIRVEYLAFPRAGIGSADYDEMVSVWCSADRKKALTDAKNDRPLPRRNCVNPVADEYALGQRVGLEGTPMILAEDGSVLGGYLPPDELQAALQELDAGQTPVASTATGGM